MNIIDLIQRIFHLGDYSSDKLGGATRSSRWPAIRAEHLRKFPSCEVCGRKAGLLKPLNVHHCVPFSIDKSLELNPENFITLCPDHHLFVGHLMSFQSFNKEVKTDSELWRKKVRNRPE